MRANAQTCARTQTNARARAVTTRHKIIKDQVETSLDHIKVFLQWGLRSISPSCNSASSNEPGRLKNWEYSTLHLYAVRPARFLLEPSGRSRRRKSLGLCVRLSLSRRPAASLGGGGDGGEGEGAPRPQLLRATSAACDSLSLLQKPPESRPLLRDTSHPLLRASASSRFSFCFSFSPALWAAEKLSIAARDSRAPCGGQRRQQQQSPLVLLQRPLVLRAGSAFLLSAWFWKVAWRTVRLSLCAAFYWFIAITFLTGS